MGGKAGINRAYDQFEETVTSFRREGDGTYTKITTIISRDRSTGATKQLKRKNPPVEEGPYEVATPMGSPFDERIGYEDPADGSMAYIYLRRVEEEADA
mgnify:CR=1 FL=1